MPQGSVRRPRDPHPPASRRPRHATRNSRNGRPLGTPPGGLARGLRLLGFVPQRAFRGAYVPVVSRAYLSRKLTRPLVTKDGGTLRTVLDARAYVLRLSKDRERSTRWQRAASLDVFMSGQCGAF